MLKNKKDFVLLLISLLIVFLIGIYFVYSQLQKPGSSSKQIVSSSNSGITLGAGVVIGQEGEKELCMAIQQYGSKFSWLTLSWARIQPANKNQWVWKQFDNWVDGYRACGQEIGVHIHSDAKWAIEPVPPDNVKGPHPPSMPAKNMQDYYNFVYEVAKHYKGRITRYSIENEAHAEQNWGGTSDQYIVILQTAYKAIKAADPNAIVEDAAMSHQGLGYLTTNWLYSQGKTQEALDFANNYAAHLYQGAKPPRFENETQLKQILSTPGVAKTIEWENKLFANHQYYDRMQIHNGAPWQNLQTVLDYLHTNLKAQGDDKNLELWEAWYGWTGAPGNGFDPNTQASDLVKQMVTAFSNKVVLYHYWTFTDFAIGEGHPGLVDNQGNPRPAATSFKITSEKLGGSTSVQKLNLGDNIYAYMFSKKGKDVFVVWSTKNSSTTLPFTGSATVTDISGKTSTVNSSVVYVSGSPIFIEQN